MMTSRKQELQREQLLSVAHHDFEKSLNSYAFYKLQNHALGEDLVQDTFIKTWGYLVRGGKIDVMKAFLYHVLNNLIVDHYRKRKTSSLDAMIDKGYEPGVNTTESMLNMLDGKAALLLISQLPEPYNKVVYMRFVQDLSLKEISLITGRSKNTIAVQVHRGMTKLRQMYFHK